MRYAEWAYRLSAKKSAWMSIVALTELMAYCMATAHRYPSSYIFHGISHCHLTTMSSRDVVWVDLTFQQTGYKKT